MFSRILRVNIQPGKMDEAIVVFKDSVAPGRSGFQSARLLVDRSGNKIIAISFWDSQADEASLESNSSYQEQFAKFAALFAGPPEVEVYEDGVEI